MSERVSVGIWAVGRLSRDDSERMERQYRADMAEWRRNIRAGQQRVRRLMAAIQSGVLAPELPFMDGAEEGEP